MRGYFGINILIVFISDPTWWSFSNMFAHDLMCDKLNEGQTINILTVSTIKIESKLTREYFL